MLARPERSNGSTGQNARVTRYSAKTNITKSKGRFSKSKSSGKSIDGKRKGSKSQSKERQLGIFDQSKSMNRSSHIEGSLGGNVMLEMN